MRNVSDEGCLFHKCTVIKQFSSGDDAAAPFEKISSLFCGRCKRDQPHLSLCSAPALVLVESQICQQDDGLKVDPGHSCRCVADNRSQSILLPTHLQLQNSLHTCSSLSNAYLFICLHRRNDAKETECSSQARVLRKGQK